MTWNRQLGAIGLMVALSRTGAELLFEVFSVKGGAMKDHRGGGKVCLSQKSA